MARLAKPPGMKHEASLYKRQHSGYIGPFVTWSAPAAAPRCKATRARAPAPGRRRAAHPARAPRSPWARAGASRPRASARRRGPPPRPPCPLAHGASRRRLITTRVTTNFHHLGTIR